MDAKQYIRYERHIELGGFGEESQIKLLNAKALIVGCGGLGCPVSLYLAASGIGHITIVDNDDIRLSNLQRQILFSVDDISKNKVDVAAQKLERINPDCKVKTINERLDENNVSHFMEGFDIVIDGTDNFDTRYMLNDACFRYRIPLVSGAVLNYDGQLSSYRPFEEGKPCYQCLYPHKPQSYEVPSCTESAVLSPVVGVIGTLMATEVIKEIVGLGQSLSGYLLMYDARAASFSKVMIPKNPNCDVCSRCIAAQ